MNRRIAREFLRAELGRLEKLPYSKLLKLLNTSQHQDCLGPDGKTYQVDTQVFWDDRRGGDLRVMVSVDDGGWRSFCPMTDSIIDPIQTDPLPL